MRNLDNISNKELEDLLKCKMEESECLIERWKKCTSKHSKSISSEYERVLLSQIVLLTDECCKYLKKLSHIAGVARIEDVKRILCRAIEGDSVLQQKTKVAS